ncbi:MAG TPA: amino acid ABC transporter permease [Terrimesophilobacter sp.]|nr:amino acid ABC transporter permease [Terrimesophilobacter sp.]
MSASVLYDSPGPKTRRRSQVASAVSLILIAALVYWVVTVLAAPRIAANGQETPGMFDSSRTDVLANPLVWQNFGNGVLATLAMAGVAAVLAILIGIFFSFVRTARSAWIRVPAVVLLEFLRGMPVLLMIFFVFLVFSTGAYWAGVLGLGLYNGAIIGEALRAGILSLPKGQREAGLAVGLSPVRTRMSIEFPQAFRQMLPIILAQLVVLLKDTSLAYVVGYDELSRTIKNMQAFLGNRYLFTIFAVGLVIYLLMNLALSWVARWVARRSGPKLGRALPNTPRQIGEEGTRAITLPKQGFGPPDPPH